jgi:hypothetical protein
MGAIRMFKFRILPGQEQAYADYLRDVVTPIDRIAHAADAFVELVTITPETESDWNHGRVFTFRDAAHRAAMPARMAAAALAFDGNAGATAQRKAFAETLRRQVSISDFWTERSRPGSVGFPVLVAGAVEPGQQREQGEEGGQAQHQLEHVARVRAGRAVALPFVPLLLRRLPAHRHGARHAAAGGHAFDVQAGGRRLCGYGKQQGQDDPAVHGSILPQNFPQRRP